MPAKVEFTSMLRYLLLLCVLFPVSVFSYTLEDLLHPISSVTNATCHNYDRFVYYLRAQSPATTDSCCYTPTVLVVDGKFPLVCEASDVFSNRSMHDLTPEMFLQAVQLRDSCGRPFCMLSFFYSKHCVFSAMLAERYAELASIFPRLLVVAVDMSVKDASTEALISQYGVAATPVIVLWNSGYPYHKITSHPRAFSNIVDLIKAKSDLKPAVLFYDDDRKINLGFDPRQEVIGISPNNSWRQTFTYDEHNPKFDWLFVFSVIVICACLIYFLEAYRIRDVPWKDFTIPCFG